MATSTNSPHIDRNNEKLRTLKGLVSAFMTQASPQIITGLTVGSLAFRLALSGWSKRDAAISLGIMAWWPIQEALAHRFLLHARPFTLFGHTIDIGKFHRDHHQHPQNLDGFVPTGLYYWVPAVGLGLSRAVLGNWPHALTAFSTWFGLALNYEWSHFFVHAPYQPKTAWGRLLRRNHMLHHYRNETFWWEVSTAGLVDHLLMRAKGFPFWSTQKEIPRSPTVRTVF